MDPELRPSGKREILNSGVLFIVLLGASLVGTLYLLPRNIAVSWVSDRGTMDFVGIGFYVLAAAFYARTASGSDGSGARLLLGAGVVILLALAFLELAPAGWTLGKFSREGAVPGGTLTLSRLAAWAVPSLIGLLLVFLAFRHRRSFWGGITRGTAAPWLLVSAAGALAVALVLDRIQGGLGWPHPGWERYAVDRGVYFAVGVVEECLEVLVPLLLLLALWNWKRSRRNLNAGAPGKEPGVSGRD